MERKAVSPDSSTQLAEKSKKSAKRKHKHRDRKKSKKAKSSSPSQDIENNDISTRSKNNKTDNERIKHLTEFLDDRKELHNELFTIVSKKEIKEMMPEILKKLSFKEVKKLCSEQLESFSKTQLKIIITGKDMASSEDESTKKEESVDETQLKRQTMNEDSKRVESKISKSIKEGKDEEKKEKDMIIFQEMITIPNQEEIDELVEGNSTAQQQTTEDTPHPAEGTVDEEAELRELEFRARALESLVRARERQMRT